MLNLGCEKDEIVAHTTNQNGGVNDVQRFDQDSSEYYLEQMAMEADIDRIDHQGSDSYSVYIEGEEDAYDVEVVTYSFDDVIEVSVEYQSSTSSAVFDMEAETVSIDGIGNFSFSQYESIFSVANNSVLENVIATAIIHHGLNSNSSVDFASGTGGDDPGDLVPFIGATHTLGPCSLGYRWHVVDYYFLWINVGESNSTEPC